MLVEALGGLADTASAPVLTALLSDAQRQESVRQAAVGALARFRDRQSLQARLALVYDANAPAALVARALPDLARLGLLPPNELGLFLESPVPAVCAAALLSMNVKKRLPADLEQAILNRLADPADDVRQAAMIASVPLGLRTAIPRLIKIARDPRSADRAAAAEALCRLPDPQAIDVYLWAIDDDNPRLRRLGEAALLAIRDRARDCAGLGSTFGQTLPARGLAIERVTARFEPIALCASSVHFRARLRNFLRAGRSTSIGRARAPLDARSPGRFGDRTPAPALST